MLWLRAHGRLGPRGAGTSVWRGGCREQAERLGGAATKLEARGQPGGAPVPGRTSEPTRQRPQWLWGGRGSSPAVAVMVGPRERGMQLQAPRCRK